MPGKHSKEYFRQYYLKNKDKLKERAAAQRKADPARVVAYNLKRFGLTPEDYRRLYEQQGGVCAVCRRTETRTTKEGLIATLCVDHNHRTGINRGLLCTNCNLALGHVGDSIEILKRLIIYLEADNAST